MLPDFGWTELLVIAIVLIVVVGPKDLPRVIRGFSKTLGSVRRMAGDFRKQFDEALADAELDDLKTLSKDVQSLDPRNQIKDALNPLGEVGKEINDELKGVARSIEQDDEAPAKKVTPQEAYPQLAKKAEEIKAAEKQSKASSTKKPATKKTAPKSTTTRKTATKSTTTASKAKTTTSKPAAAKTPAKTAAKPAATKKPAASKAPAAKKTAARSRKPAVSKAGEA